MERSGLYVGGVAGCTAQHGASRPGSPQRRELETQIGKAKQAAEKEQKRGERYRAFLVELDRLVGAIDGLRVS